MTGGCSEGLDAFKFSFNSNYLLLNINTRYVLIALPVLQAFHIVAGSTPLQPGPCINDEIESVHRICRVTDSVDRFYFGSKRPYLEMRCH